MAVDTKHPGYVAYQPDWEQLEHCYQGERIIKAMGTRYLPATGGMVEDGMASEVDAGWIQYDAYRKRAVFPDYVRDAVEGLGGLMHRRPPKITLPAALEPLRTNATVDGVGLIDLLRMINEEQLKKGRIGLLGEVPNGAAVGALPFIATYTASTIINWDTARPLNGQTQLQLVVLDESGQKRQSDLTWREVKQYRVLTLAGALDPAATAYGKYEFATSEPTSTSLPTSFTKASLAGRDLDEIPFVFINAQDLLPEPDRPPLLGLSNSCLKIYRGEADYRQTLFLQGQETLVIIGEDEQIDPATGQTKSQRVGAGALISLPAVTGADAKYVGVSADGLGEQRQALEADRMEAGEQGVKLLDGGGSESHASSGDALRVRVAARTASLVSIARTGAAGLEQMLKKLAVWVGANPDEVKIEPNLDFGNQALLAQELLQFAQAKAMGAPISWESIHILMAQRELTQKTYEEEQAAIEAEPPPPGTTTGAPGDNPQDNGGNGK